MGVMAERTCLVFDVGASNGRAVVGLFDGERFTLDVTHRFDNAPVRATGTLYWDLLRLYAEMQIGLQKSLHAHPSISSLGVDTWGADFGLIDGKGRLLTNPVCYRDERRNAAADEAYAIIPRRELFRLSGAPVLSLMSLFNLYAMKKDDASELSAADGFLMMPDLFHYLFTGEAFNEYSNSSVTVAYNQSEKKWEPRILDPLGIPVRLFQPPVLPGCRIGSISPAVRRELDAPPIAVIAPATHDTASAEAGIPVRDAARSWAFLSLGTWGVIGRETPAPLLTDLVFESGWGNEGSAEGKSFLAVNVTGLWIAQQCRQRWIADRGGDLTWEEIVRASLAAPRMATFIDVDDPVFSPVHPDVPGLIQSYCSQRGLPQPESIGEIARCIYESLALKFRHRFAQLERLTGERIELIHLVGGGARNEPLCQWTADATGIPVVAGPTEATVAGNLVMQLKGLGDVGDCSQGRQIIALSSQTRRYSPGDTGLWDETYARFARFIGK